MTNDLKGTSHIITMGKFTHGKTGEQINDECTKCAELLQCELFKQGHGIRQPRTNIRQMLECQMRHREKAGGSE